MKNAANLSCQKVLNEFLDYKQPPESWQSQFNGALRVVVTGATGSKGIGQDELEQWLSTQDILSLGKFWNWFEAGSQLLGLKEGTLTNQRSKLNQWVKWFQQQEWYKPSDQIAIRVQSQRGERRDIPSKSRSKRGVSPSCRRIDRIVYPMPVYLSDAVKNFRRYLTSKNERRPQWNRKSPARWEILKDTSADARVESLLQYWGWMIQEGGYTLSSQLIEDSAKEQWMGRYLDWLEEQNRSANRVMSIISTLDCLLKWHYRSSYSTVDQYLNLEPVQWLRSVRNSWQEAIKDYRISQERRRKQESKMIDGEGNPLTWDTIQSVVPLLEQETRPKNYAGKERKELSIAIRFYNYLLFSMFALFLPIRQGEIRSLRIGESIVRHKDCWVLNLDPDMTKNGLRKRINIKVWDKKLNQILDEWVDVHRPLILKEGGIEPDHNYLFVQCRYTKGRGLPLIAVKNPRGSVAGTIRNILWRYLGNDINPHFFRNLFNNWVNRNAGIPADAIRGIAYLLDQSEEQWHETYRISQPDDEMQLGIDSLKNLSQRPTDLENPPPQ